MGVWSRLPGNYIDDIKPQGVYLTTAYQHQGLLVLVMKELGGDSLAMVLAGTQVIGITKFSGAIPGLDKLVKKALKEMDTAADTD